MKIKENRISSFVNIGNQYIAKGRTEKAIKEVENENEGAKELYEGFKEITSLPKLKQTEKIKKPNKKL